MKYLVLSIFLGLSWNVAYSALVEKTVSYMDGSAALEGYLVYDGSFQGIRPGILLVHEWWGLNPYIMSRARQMAGLGYVVFAADIYGKDNRPKDMKEAGKFSGMFSADRTLMLSRANAGLNELLKSDQLDKTRIAAIGYCFGGGVALELARSGADIKGVVTFHGSLGTPTNENYDNTKARILALHGANDPFVNTAVVNEFEDSLKKANLDWQVVLYGGAVHGFSNPDNGTNAASGLAYNESADKRSWAAMKMFLEDLFAK